MKALPVYVGPRAPEHLRQRGLSGAEVRIIPAAAGGPKGLALLALDRFIFGHWRAAASQTVHLVGASIGAWRMAAACLPDAGAALALLGGDCIAQSYPHVPGKMPTAKVVTEVFARQLEARLGSRADEVLLHARPGCMCSPAAAAGSCTGPQARDRCWAGALPSAPTR